MAETQRTKKRVALSLTPAEQRRLHVRASIDGQTMSAWVMDRVNDAEQNATSTTPGSENKGASA